jgi:hypothetical protein
MKGLARTVWILGRFSTAKETFIPGLSVYKDRQVSKCGEVLPRKG